MMIGIIDVGFGNIGSLRRALSYLDLEFRVANENNFKDVSKECSRLILPGVGSYKYASERLSNSRIQDDIKGQVAEGKPLLGICLGMQLLFESSTEGGLSIGLDFFEGNCESFSSDLSFEERLPHVGYNSVVVQKDDRLWKDIASGTPFYFIHTFRVAKMHSSTQRFEGTTNYGGCNFVSYVRRDNIVGVQFHPEKSQKAGLRLIKNFAGMEF